MPVDRPEETAMPWYPRKRRWYYHDWTRYILTVGERKVQLSEQLSENHLIQLGQCVTVVLGKDTATDEPVVSKLRYESVLILILINFSAFYWSVNIRLKPAAIDGEELESYYDSAARLFETECLALKAADGSGHTPHGIDCDIQEQASDMPYPEGYLLILLMSFVPGVNPLSIWHSLTKDDLQIMRTQLDQSLEWVMLNFALN